MKKRRRMTAKQLKYFGPRRTRKKTKVVNIARRRRYGRVRTVYSRARRGYSRRKGLLSGNTGNIVIGAVAGAASPMIPQFLGGWTNPLVFGGLGYFLKKPALLTIAGYEAGKNLTSGGLLGGGGDSSGGWL